MTLQSCLRMATGAALAVLLLTGCATKPTTGDSQRFEAGKSAYLAGHFSQAFELMLREAEDGNPEAQYTVGFMYYQGQGVNEDERAALRWIQRSANAGNDRAIQALGQLSGMGSRPASGNAEESEETEDGSPSLTE